MVVVQDKDEIVRDGGDFIEQGCQNRFDGRRLRGLEHTQHPFSNIRRNRLQSSDEVRQKAGGVVIPFVQRQPGDRSLATGNPFADQRGFAKAGGGRDEGQLAAAEPSFSRSIRRGRRTTLGRGGGIYSFVAKIGVGIDQL